MAGAVGFYAKETKRTKTRSRGDDGETAAGRTRYMARKPELAGNSLATRRSRLRFDGVEKFRFELPPCGRGLGIADYIDLAVVPLARAAEPVVFDRQGFLHRSASRTAQPHVQPAAVTQAFPKISVVTASYNSAGTIRDTIQSVARQDFAGVEHIVVDGGSTDGTVEVLKSHPHVKWTSEKDQGHYHAMNKGIAMASCELLVMLNADDCFRPGALRAVAEAFQKNPAWDAAFGDVVFVDAAGHRIYQREEAVYDYGVLLYGLDYICHQTLFVRKTVHDRIGVYRHKEFPHAADFEFKLRLGRAGCKVGHVPQLLVDFRYHADNISSDLKRIRNSNREAAVIRREYGNPGGMRGACLRVVFKAKRQLQKFVTRGTCDFVPGTWRLRSHVRERGELSHDSGPKAPG